MKKLLILGAVMLSASAAFAGMAAPPPDPVVDGTSSSDATGALVLLALVGMVIASASFAGRAKTEREPDPFVLDDEAN